MKQEQELIERLNARLGNWQLDIKETQYALAVFLRLEERDVPITDASDEVFSKTVNAIQHYHKGRAGKEKVTDLVQRVLGRELVFPRHVQKTAEQAVEARVPRSHSAFFLLAAFEVIGHKIGEWTDEDLAVVTRVSTSLSDEGFGLRQVLEIIEYLLDDNGLRHSEEELTKRIDYAVEAVVG